MFTIHVPLNYFILNFTQVLTVLPSFQDFYFKNNNGIAFTISYLKKYMHIVQVEKEVLVFLFKTDLMPIILIPVSLI